MESQKSDFEKLNVQILMLGLDGAGKTTLLYKLILGDGNDLKTVPTIGYNVETIETEGKSYTFWDIGGLDSVRVLWKFYAENKTAVIFVVDASNPARFNEAKDFLHTTMAHEALSDVTLLVISNKHDKHACVNNEEFNGKLNLRNIKQPIHIVNTSAFDRLSLNNLMVQLSDINLSC